MKKTLSIPHSILYDPLLQRHPRMLGLLLTLAVQSRDTKDSISIHTANLLGMLPEDEREFVARGFMENHRGMLSFPWLSGIRKPKRAVELPFTPMQAWEYVHEGARKGVVMEPDARVISKGTAIGMTQWIRKFPHRETWVALGKVFEQQTWRTDQVDPSVMASAKMGTWLYDAAEMAAADEFGYRSVPLVPTGKLTVSLGTGGNRCIPPANTLVAGGGAEETSRSRVYDPS